MDLHNEKTNMRTYTLKKRRKIKKLISYIDVREHMFKEHELRGLPEPTQEEILARCDEVGVNLETLQSKRNATSPVVRHCSSQRLVMTSGQIASSNPLMKEYADYPYFDSSMRHDLYVRSSCIKRASGVVKLIAVIKYQFRKIYVYQLNGVYHYLDTAGLKNTNGFCVKENTDFDLLPIGEEVDISQDSFLIKYPDQYNPTTDTVAMGLNVRTIVSTNVDNSGDSNKVSQSLLTRLSTLKQKVVRIKLNNKSIKSKYPGKFPPLGEILTDPIVFKIVNDTGYVSELAQSARMSTGSEDDTIVVNKNSFISGIEVYCNNPIKDPDLEKYRLELLDFRHRVYDVVAPLVNNFPDKCSPELKILKENFSYDLFQANLEEIIAPYIVMSITTISEGAIGTKLSSNVGAKTTIQKVYPDGYYTDEFGNNIDQIFPSTAIINRTVAGLPVEMFITSIGEFLKNRILRNEITPEKTFEFVEKLFDILDLSDDFKYSKMTPDSLYKYIKSDFLRIITLPYSSSINMKNMARLQELAEEYLGYKQLKIYVGMKEKIETTSQHTVGYIYTFRDYHDSEYGSSSASSQVERDTKGFVSERSNSKREARTNYNKKCTKLDIQNQHIILNMLHNEDADIMLNGNDPSDTLYNVKETMESIGIGLNFRINNEDNDDIDD